MKINKLNLTLFFIYSLLSSIAMAEDDCIQNTLANTSEIISPLQQALGKEAFDEAMASKKYSYTGNAKCRLCHRDFFLGRKEDKHDHAYEKLVATQPEHAENPRCMTCHTTGHGVRSGFKNMKRTARLANVQCEGCHGPGSVHIKLQAKNMPTGGTSQIEKNSREVLGGFLAGTDKPEILKKMCKSCHKKRWSRNINNFENEYFNYKTAKPDSKK